MDEDAQNDFYQVALICWFGLVVWVLPVVEEREGGPRTSNPPIQATKYGEADSRGQQKTHPIFHLLKTISYFPLLGLKGICHWTYRLLFQGGETSEGNWRQCVSRQRFFHLVENMFLFPPVGFKGNLSRLDIFISFFPGDKNANGGFEPVNYIQRPRFPRTGAGPMGDFVMGQITTRITEPERSLRFYRELGMKLLSIQPVTPLSLERHGQTAADFFGASKPLKTPFCKVVPSYVT